MIIVEDIVANRAEHMFDSWDDCYYQTGIHVLFSRLLWLTDRNEHLIIVVIVSLLGSLKPQQTGKNIQLLWLLLHY